MDNVNSGSSARKVTVSIRSWLPLFLISIDLHRNLDGTAVISFRLTLFPPNFFYRSYTTQRHTKYKYTKY